MLAVPSQTFFVLYKPVQKLWVEAIRSLCVDNNINTVTFLPNTTSLGSKVSTLDDVFIDCPVLPKALTSVDSFQLS